jgi:hypothetical protein
MEVKIKEVQVCYILLYPFQLGHNATMQIENFCKAIKAAAIKIEKWQI